jgi:hypothetical protein
MLNWEDESFQRHLSCVQEQGDRRSAGQKRPVALVRERRVGEREIGRWRTASSKNGARAVPLLAISSLDRVR